MGFFYVPPFYQFYQKIKVEEEEVILEYVKKVDYVQGDMFLFDKPIGWTSFDVVNKVRRTITKSIGRKIKVGHAGTLDPLASGLLLLAIGRMTKQIKQFQGLGKTYEGILKLGATTPCYDSEMEEDQQFPTEHITEEMIHQKTAQFTGEIDQVVPTFSAIKVDGKRMYKLARAGEKAPVRSRTIEIYEFNIDEINMPHVSFTAKCSKGTYIRSLAHDFGASLNSGAYLTGLKRTEVGDLKLENAWNVKSFVNAMRNFKLEAE